MVSHTRRHQERGNTYNNIKQTDDEQKSNPNIISNSNPVIWLDSFLTNTS